jgi:hypothetical protein
MVFGLMLSILVSVAESQKSFGLSYSASVGSPANSTTIAEFNTEAPAELSWR